MRHHEETYSDGFIEDTLKSKRYFWVWHPSAERSTGFTSFVRLQRHLYAKRMNPGRKTYNLLLLIYSFYFYSAPSSPLLLRGAPNTARILCRNFMPKRHRQLWVKDLDKGYYATWIKDIISIIIHAPLILANLIIRKEIRERQNRLKSQSSIINNRCTRGVNKLRRTTLPHI